MLFFTNGHAVIHHVNVRDNTFTPAHITVEAGDTVRWENEGIMNHNIASRSIDYIFRCANGCDDSGGNGNATGQGWISEVTFHSQNSNIPYVCEPHESTMSGSIKVQFPIEYSHVNLNVFNGFQPNQLTVYQGTRVMFNNIGGDHNFRADDDRFQCANGCRNDGMLNNNTYLGGTWQTFLTFNTLGSIPYHCENPNHTETGVIHVIEEPAIFANGFESP